MWTLLLTLIINNISFKDNSAEYLDYHKGAFFKELAPDLKDRLHKAKKWSVYNAKAPNTDCWVYSETCKPNKVTYKYQIEIPEHAGFFYTITFSANYKILSVYNGHSKAEL